MDYIYLSKSVFLFGILLLTVFQDSSAINDFLTKDNRTDTKYSKQEVNHKDVGCGNYQLNSSLSFRIQSPYSQKDNHSRSSECTWEFYGTSECNPEITCDTFNLIESASCSSQFLELYDAIDARVKFCGKKAPKVAVSSSILIASFKTEVHEGNKGFSCNVACAQPHKVILPPLVCILGTPKNGSEEAKGASTFIVGGQATTWDQFPYQVSLQSGGSHICGGSLIAANRILTAAHCTDGESASSLSIRIGSSYRGSGGQVIKVTSICQHPRYNPSTTDNDVSVLRLASSPTVGKSICLQPVGYDTPVGTLALATGWGLTSEGGSPASQLQGVIVPRVSDPNCKNAYGSSAITPNMVCFGYPQGGKDTCQGDSGGPLVVGNRQVGVVSWGAGCARPGYPGVYAKLSAPSINLHILSC